MDYVSAVVQGISSNRWVFPSGGVAIGTFILLAGYIRIRAGSSFIVWDLMWRYLAGKDAFQNDKLRSFFSESKDVERYRFIYRLKVGTVARAQRLITFLKDHDISIAEFRKISSWTDIDGPAVVLNTVAAFERRMVAVGAFVGMLLFLLATSAAAYGSAQLETIGTKVSFVSDGEVVFKHILWGQSFSLQLCVHNQDIIQRGMGFSSEETAAICEFHQNGKFRSFVRQTVFQQRMAAAIMAFMVFCGVYWCGRTLDNMLLAKRIKNRIEQPTLISPG